MKTIFGSRKYHYVARVCIFLITLALVVEMVGCSCGGGGGGGVNYNLTISSTAGGKVTNPGEGTFTYNKGRRVDLVATPAKGYSFDKWTGNTSTIVNPNAASTKITMNGAYSITANFKVVYNLTISSYGGGKVTQPGEGTFTYDANTSVTVVATPDPGYRFEGWVLPIGTIDNVNANAASITITMTQDYSITAKFVAVVYDLTIFSTTGGSVTTPGEAGPYTYDEGEVVDLVAEPEEGYSFVNWTGNVGTVDDVTAASTYITMNGNYTITANFEKIPQYTLITGSYEYQGYYEGEYWEGGYVWKPPEGIIHTYDEGEVVELEAVSIDPWCHFVRWTGNDTSTIDDVDSSRTTITMMDHYVIVAYFVWYIPE